ncbi:SHOCT domain-containing protein [Modestobacter sp. DSM 44400]|uniref:SHOCT domain-containing protein n=1 Tax=Modestobacter sp. DSM 44400 TaxID=1550230 RepID=UPI001115085A|nr:SHOCT domain-containing protein [Modestobacter sp. DSM 44400]
MLIWAVLVIALIAVAVVLVVRTVRGPESAPRGAVGWRDDRSAEDQLRMRYARGELDSEDFRQRMQELQDN